MASPDQLFALEEVNTEVTQPITQVSAQGPLDSSARNQQTLSSIKALGASLGNLAEYTKRKRIKEDIVVAQEAAVRNELMPGGLLPVAQQAYRDTQDIDTVNKVLTEAKIFKDSEEVKSIVNHVGWTTKQKNDDLGTKFDGFFNTSSSSIQNPDSLLRLKGGLEKLKLESMEDVILIERGHQFGTTVSAINGNINQAFEQNEYNPSDIFTSNWLQKNVTKIRTALPWISGDDAKLAMFNLLATNEEMLTHPDIILNIMNSNFSKGVTFSALANSQTTPAGKEINTIYTKYLSAVDKFQRDELTDLRLAQETLNSNGREQGTELLEALRSPGDTTTYQTIDGEQTVSFENRWKVLREIMVDQNGAETGEYNKMVRMWDKAEGYIKNGVNSEEHSQVENLIYSGAIQNKKVLWEHALALELDSESHSLLLGFLGEDHTLMNKYRATGTLRTSIVSSGLLTVIKDALKPESGLMTLIMEGLQNNPEALGKALTTKNSQIVKLLGKARLDPKKYIEAMRVFAKAKHEVDQQIKEEARRAILAGEEPNFDRISSSWDRTAQGFMNTLEADMQKIAEEDVQKKAEAEELAKEAKIQAAKEADAKKSPEQKVKEEKEAATTEFLQKSFDKEFQKDILESQKAEIQKKKEEKLLGTTNVTPEVREALSNPSWFTKNFVPPSLLKWGLDAKRLAPDLFKEDLKRGKKFWTDILENILESPTLYTPFGMQLEEEIKEKNKSKYDLLNNGKTIKDVKEPLAKVNDDWSLFNTFASIVSPTEASAAESTDEPIVLDEITVTAPKPIKAGTKKKGKNLGGMAGEEPLIKKEAIGEEVSNAAINTAIKVLGDDSGILKFIANKESRFGTDKNTFKQKEKADYHGGIFQVDKIGFEATQDTKSHPSLKTHYKKIKNELGIDWTKVTWKDLRKPLYSALAARLFLKNISKDMENKAGLTMANHEAYWQKFYNTIAGQKKREQRKAKGNR